MSLLSAVQNVAKLAGYSVDNNAVVTSSDTTTQQLYAIANRVIHDISDAYPWQKLWNSASFTLVNGQATYPVPGDFSYYHYDTFWNQSSRWKVYGALSPQDYATIRGWDFTEHPYDNFTFKGATDNEILIDPTPTASGDVIIFEYISDRIVRPVRWTTGTAFTTGAYCSYNGNYYIAASSGTTGATPPTWTSGTSSDGAINWTYYSGSYSGFLADTDEPVVSQKLLEQGMFERFAEIKGITFVPRFETQLAEEYSKSLPGKTVFAGGSGSIRSISALNGRAGIITWPN